MGMPKFPLWTRQKEVGLNWERTSIEVYKKRKYRNEETVFHLVLTTLFDVYHFI